MPGDEILSPLPEILPVSETGDPVWASRTLEMYPRGIRLQVVRQSLVLPPLKLAIG